MKDTFLTRIFILTGSLLPLFYHTCLSADSQKTDTTQIVTNMVDTSNSELVPYTWVDANGVTWLETYFSGPMVITPLTNRVK